MDSLDTNLLVRYYTDDEPRQRAQVVALLKAGGPLFVTVTVILELVWVLDRVFGIPRARIVGVLRHLLALEPVRIEAEPAVAAAVESYARGLDFADALHLSASTHCKRLLTFDRRFASRATKLGLTPACVVPGAIR